MDRKMEKINLCTILSQASRLNHNGHDVALSFLKTISTDFGIYIKPSFLPELFRFGENDKDDMLHSMVSRIIAPDYDCTEDLVNNLKEGNIPMSCQKYLSDKLFQRSLWSTSVDHERTLKTLRARGIVSGSGMLSEICQYLSHLKNAGILFKNNEWEEELPQDYLNYVTSPQQEVVMHAAAGKHLAACPPGWTSLHDGRSVYRLRNNWYDDPRLAKMIKLYQDDSKFTLTHSICPKCEKVYSEEIKS